MTEKIISITQKGIAVAELLISQEKELNEAFADWLNVLITNHTLPIQVVWSIKEKIKELQEKKDDSVS